LISHGNQAPLLDVEKVRAFPQWDNIGKKNVGKSKPDFQRASPSYRNTVARKTPPTTAIPDMTTKFSLMN
jgi:hypothetical protein